ncbi:MAG: twin-arginine translocase TatA/TatE family subunit [Gemmatimonadales bacterium]
MPTIGVWELVILFLIVLLVFGAKRLPEVGSSLGKGIREFKKSIREVKDNLDEGDDQTTLASRQLDAREDEGEPKKLSE